MKRVIIAAALGTFGTVLHAAPGYVTQGSATGTPVTSGFGLCVHDGFWRPSMAAEPCDRVPRGALPPAPVAKASPEPPAAAAAPEPAPLAAKAPPLEKVTLSSDVLFQFDKAELTEPGKRELDALADRVRDAQVESITLVGHADRIGADQYNQKLSERRAEAVKNYLQSKAGTQQIAASGKGESEPVTGEQCKGVKNRDRLIQCLQPDRRVEVEVFGTRTAGSASPAASGSSAGSSR